MRASQGRTTQASWVWLTGPSELFPAFMTPWGEALVTHVSGVAHLTLVRSNDSRLEGQPCPRPPAGRSEKCCLDRFHPPEPTDPVGGMRLCAYLLMTWAKEVAGDLQGACRGHQSRLPGRRGGRGDQGACVAGTCWRFEGRGQRVFVIVGRGWRGRPPTLQSQPSLLAELAGRGEAPSDSGEWQTPRGFACSVDDRHSCISPRVQKHVFMDFVCMHSSAELSLDDFAFSPNY